MHSVIWIVTGLLAGIVARLVMRSPRMGLSGDVALGAMGSVMGAWLLRTVGGTMPPAESPRHLIVSIVGAMVLVGIGRVAMQLTDRARTYAPYAPLRRTVADIEGHIAKLGDRERNVIAALLRREPVSQDSNQAFAGQLTFGQRVADRVAEVGGSWTFLGLFGAFMLGWLLLNTERRGSFDPYPFILLNLVLSCLAAVQAPIIMMSQNRQAARDRLEAQQDYQVNLKAEMEVMALHVKIDVARDQQWQTLLDLQQQQMHVLATIEDRIGALEHGSRPRDGSTRT